MSSDCKKLAQFWTQPGLLFTPSLLSCFAVPAIQPAPASHALGREECLHAQESGERSPHLGKPKEAKLLAKSNQPRTTADGEPRVTEMPPVRITESFGSEGTPRGHLVQPPCSE